MADVVYQTPDHVRIDDSSMVNAPTISGARKPGIFAIVLVIPNKRPVNAGAKSAWFTFTLKYESYFMIRNESSTYEANMHPLNMQQRQMRVMTANWLHPKKGMSPIKNAGGTSESIWNIFRTFVLINVFKPKL